MAGIVQIGVDLKDSVVVAVVVTLPYSVGSVDVWFHTVGSVVVNKVLEVMFQMVSFVGQSPVDLSITGIEVAVNLFDKVMDSCNESLLDVVFMLQDVILETGYFLFVS